MEQGTKKSSRGTSKFDDLVNQRKITEAEKTKLIDEITTIKNKRFGYIKGLDEAIKKHYIPKGFWEKYDIFTNPNGEFTIWSRVRYGANQEGVFVRKYNPNDKSFTFDVGFLKLDGAEKLPTWVEDVKIPLDPEKGIPTQAYFTLKQMKLLKIPENGIEKVKMSTIQNLHTMAYVDQIFTKNKITDLAKVNILEAPSMNYVKTAMEQAGYHLKNAKIIPIKKTRLVTIRELKNDEYNFPEGFSKYGYTDDKKLYIDFNIEIETVPINKN